MNWFCETAFRGERRSSRRHNEGRQRPEPIGNSASTTTNNVESRPILSQRLARPTSGALVAQQSRLPGAACVARVVPPIRAVLDRSDVVVIDASEDGPQAADTFCLAASCLGARATAVYTEQMHEGLELLVRVRGSQLLLGPLDDAQWEGFSSGPIRTESSSLVEDGSVGAGRQD